jgi:2-phospho-L-lactate guanylyltransferase (CobY/MobA/RfbA family)
VPGDLSGLRHDVDDRADLAAAVRLGLGAHSAAAVAALVPELLEMP